jgi:hypothetical protein
MKLTQDQGVKEISDSVFGLLGQRASPYDLDSVLCALLGWGLTFHL